MSSSSDELPSLEEESEEPLLSTLPFPLRVGALAGFSSSDDSSESDEGAAFLVGSSSEEESDDSSLDSETFPFDAFGTACGGEVRSEENN